MPRKTSFTSPERTYSDTSAGSVSRANAPQYGHCRSAYSTSVSGACGEPRTLPRWGMPAKSVGCARGAAGLRLPPPENWLAVISAAVESAAATSAAPYSRRRDLVLVITRTVGGERAGDIRGAADRRQYLTASGVLRSTSTATPVVPAGGARTTSPRSARYGARWRPTIFPGGHAIGSPCAIGLGRGPRERSVRRYAGSPPVSSNPRRMGWKDCGVTGAPASAAITSATARACCAARPP